MKYLKIEMTQLFTRFTLFVFLGLWLLPTQICFADSSTPTEQLSVESKKNSCLDGMGENPVLGELSTVAFDFGTRMIMTNSKCSAPFRISIHRIKHECSVCGQHSFRTEKKIGKQEFLKLESPIFADGSMILFKRKNENSMWMTCTTVGKSKLSADLDAKQAIHALKLAKISCLKTAPTKDRNDLIEKSPVEVAKQ